MIGMKIGTRVDGAYISDVIGAVPFIVAAIWFGFKERFDAHTRITRWLWPVWMYVSVTGVLIYLMLYILPQPA